MERDWNRLTTDERAEFAVWTEERQATAKAKVRAEIEAAARPKRYEAMTDAERVAFKRSLGRLPSKVRA